MVPFSAFAIQDATIVNYNAIVYSMDSIQPVVPKGTGSDWDAGGMREISNVLDDSGASDSTQRFKMIFPGYPTENSPTNEKAGYAYSADGLNWTKYASNPVAFAGGGNWYLEDPYLIKSGSTYYMYYEDKVDGTRIGLRTSTDFLNWSAQTVALSKGTAGDWDDQDATSPTVWVEGGTWYLFYEGRKSGGQAGEIGLATSSDGITFTKNTPNPVISLGAGGAWDNGSVVPDDIQKIDSTYYMIYHGSQSDLKYHEGLATSTDLVNWTRVGSTFIFPNLRASWGNPQWFTAFNGNHYLLINRTNFQCYEFQFIQGRGVNARGISITNTGVN